MTSAIGRVISIISPDSNLCSNCLTGLFIFGRIVSVKPSFNYTLMTCGTFHRLSILCFHRLFLSYQYTVGAAVSQVEALAHSKQSNNLINQFSFKPHAYSGAIFKLNQNNTSNPPKHMKGLSSVVACSSSPGKLAEDCIGQQSLFQSAGLFLPSYPIHH